MTKWNYRAQPMTIDDESKNVRDSKGVVLFTVRGNVFERMARGREILRALNGIPEMEADLRRYRKAFGHYHVASADDLDTCHQCGLDIRDAIHTKEEQ